MLMADLHTGQSQLGGSYQKSVNFESPGHEANHMRVRASHQLNLRAAERKLTLSGSQDVRQRLGF